MCQKREKLHNKKVNTRVGHQHTQSSLFLFITLLNRVLVRLQVLCCCCLCYRLLLCGCCLLGCQLPEKRAEVCVCTSVEICSESRGHPQKTDSSKQHYSLLCLVPGCLLACRVPLCFGLDLVLLDLVRRVGVWVYVQDLQLRVVECASCDVNVQSFSPCLMCMLMYSAAHFIS